MIYITGDTHGEHARFDNDGVLGQERPEQGDTLIVCGDFGYLFFDDDIENAFLDELEKKPYTICFCDGNHENFNAIYSYPVEVWNGGCVHRIRKNVLHLMRGQIFCIDGKKIFTMGGAYSIDKYLRKEGHSWWKEELPTDAEYKEAVQTLKRSDNCVDYIVTHTAPREIIRRMGISPDMHDAELTGFLEWVMYEVSFKRWFFGHWHMDREITDRFQVLMFDVVKIE